MYEQVKVNRAVYGAGEDRLILGSAEDNPLALSDFYGQVQCVYLDPPFMTGEKFQRKRACGEADWKRGTMSLTLPAYEDQFDSEDAYLKMLRGMVESAWSLLRPEGVFCLHLDWRMSARARLMCDEIFGQKRFLNEIIWGYESGGRSKKTFSRKHDTILLYARTGKYYFDITRVPLPRAENRKNHMARSLDENGRAYSSIHTRGKEYRYYDDEPVYPGDVWTDIGFLQQRDPERTGYATQKPLKLLERLLLPVTRPGDWVADLCCGSGTTLAAAEGMGCHLLGMDTSSEALSVTLSRLSARNLTIACPTDESPAEALAEYDAGYLRVRGIGVSGVPFPEKATPMDCLESWETGRIEGDTFRVNRRYLRTNRYPALQETLAVDPGHVPDLLLTDASGARRAYRWKE